MKHTPTTIVDLSRLSLSYGEGRRLEVPVRLDSLQLGGQPYAANPETVVACLDISRTSGGYALRLRVSVHVEGPCMRCLAPAGIDLEIDAREVDQHDTDDEALSQPLRREGRARYRPLGPRCQRPRHPSPVPVPHRLRRALPVLR